MAPWMDLEVPNWVLVALALILVLLVSRKPPSPRHDTHDAAATMTASRGKAAPETEVVASEEAKSVAEHLGVTVRQRPVPVTICVNDLVLRREHRAEWSPIESAVRVVTLLNEVAAVFLVAWVDSDEEERAVMDAALSSGLVRPSDGASPPSAVAEHRLLFCSTHIGQVAIVRQLASSVHIGGSIVLLEGISRFVPTLVRIDPDAIEMLPSSRAPEAAGGNGVDSLGWREFKSLAAAAGLTSEARSSLPSPRASAEDKFLVNAETLSRHDDALPLTAGEIEAKLRPADKASAPAAS